MMIRRILQSALTIVVRTDRKRPRLTGCDSLDDREEGSTQSPNTFLEKNGTGVECRSSRWNLDTDAIFGNAEFLKFVGVRASLSHNFVGVVGVVGRDLEKNTALEVVDVLDAKEGALYVGRDSEKAVGLLDR